MGSSATSLILPFVGALLASALASAATAILAALGEHRTAALLQSGRPGSLRSVVARRDAVRLALLTLDALAKLALGVLLAMAAARGTGPLLLAGSVAIVLLVITVTRSVFLRRPERSLVVVAPFARAVDLLLAPLVMPLVALSRAARAGSPAAQHDDKELEYLIEASAREGAIDPARRDLLESVMEFSRVRVREIMVPRPKVVALAASASYEEVLRVVTESEHSRLPVYEGSIDEVVGILYARRLLKESGPSRRASFRLHEHVSEPYFVPETMRISVLLTEFQRRRTHIAVVVDEFGGTAGIVTLEDVVEEIVGEIRDETDGEELRMRRLRDGVFVADGGVSLRDLEALLEDLLPSKDRFEFPEGDFETLAGFVTAELGRVAEPGATVRHRDLLFTVRTADAKRVSRVEISRAPEEAAEEEGGEPAAPGEERADDGRGL